MAKTPEKRVKDKTVAMLKARGAYYFYPVTAGYGSSGVPDIVACYEGTFYGIECKAGKNPPTKLQVKNLKQIEQAGGIAVIIDEENVFDVFDILELNEDAIERARKKWSKFI